MAILAPTPYAVLQDVYDTGMPLAAMGAVTTAQQQKMLDHANAKIDSLLGAKFHLPLTSWGPDLVNAAVVLTVFAIISYRGFDPEDPGDQVFKERRDNVTTWLTLISKGEASPVVVDSTPGGKGGAGGDPFTTQSRTQFATTQSQIDGQVTVNSDGQSGQVFVGRPSLRGW